MSSWKVWLNTNPNSLDSPISSGNKKRNPIGKNVWYSGSQENIWKTEYIIIIGFAKIYNESSLWEKIGKTKTSTNSLEIIVELYKIHGFETALEYLDGDFGFVLIDHNIFGEEALLYVAKDAFGLLPLYKSEYPDTSCKKVSFVPSENNPISEFVENTSISEMKASPLYIEIPSPPYGNGYSGKYVYSCCFSSEDETLESGSIQPMPNGTYMTYRHSYKVSANWKKLLEDQSFYQLPFQSTYNDRKYIFSSPNPNRLEEQIRVAIQKRINWIQESSETKTIGLLNISIGNKKATDFADKINTVIKQNTFGNIFEIGLHLFAEKEIEENESITMVYLEEKYPTILQEIKRKIQSNDPSIIRDHFIPAIVAKHIVEKYHEIKVILMKEAFTYEYLEMNMFERRKWIRNVSFLEKIRAWTETFLVYGLDIYMPFIDRMLIQSPDQYSRV